MYHAIRLMFQLARRRSLKVRASRFVDVDVTISTLLLLGDGARFPNE